MKTNTRHMINEMYIHWKMINDKSKDRYSSKTKKNFCFFNKPLIQKLKKNLLFDYQIKLQIESVNLMIIDMNKSNLYLIKNLIFPKTHKNSYFYYLLKTDVIHVFNRVI